MESEHSIPKAYICGIGMITAVGDSAPMTAASVRAGINRYTNTRYLNKRLNPIKLALVPDEILPNLNENITNVPQRLARMLRLVQPALAQVLEKLPDSQSIPFFLSVSENLPYIPPLPFANFLDQVLLQSGVALDRENSMIFTTGRAGGLIALETAMNSLSAGTFDVVLVGGVDSFLDSMLLGALDSDDRILAEGAMNGFAGGDGAGFIALASHKAISSLGLTPIAKISAPGIASEAGHRFSTAPYTGDGLSEAFSEALARYNGDNIKTIFSSLNGEQFGAKEISVARTRNTDRLASDVRLEHPADCFGDIGAAFTPVLMGLCAFGMKKGYVKGPALVYCSSDGEYRGAVCIDSV